MGMTPSGEGDLEKSCQLQAAVEPLVLAGDSSDGSCSLGTPLPVESFLEGCFLWRTGERLFGRGLRSMDSSDEDSCSSFKISCPFPCFCALDLVVGAVYPASDPDSGAGLGEVTLGVAGMDL